MTYTHCTRVLDRDLTAEGAFKQIKYKYAVYLCLCIRVAMVPVEHELSFNIGSITLLSLRRLLLYWPRSVIFSFYPRVSLGSVIFNTVHVTFVPISNQSINQPDQCCMQGPTLKYCNLLLSSMDMKYLRALVYYSLGTIGLVSSRATCKKTLI